MLSTNLQQSATSTTGSLLAILLCGLLHTFHGTNTDTDTDTNKGGRILSIDDAGATVISLYPFIQLILSPCGIGTKYLFSLYEYNRHRS